jgi:hypothetical protein
MKTFLLWGLLGLLNGFVASIFFSVFSWQFWATTFVVFLLFLAIEYAFFTAEEDKDAP